MKKEEILKVVRSNEGTVLSFPDRGPWGNNRYRGNCSGYIHAFLIDQYNVDLWRKCMQVVVLVMIYVKICR